MSIYYIVPDDCEISRYKLNATDNWTVEEILIYDLARSFATDCAQDYWDCHDGWESGWPLEFHLYESQDSLEPFFKCKIYTESEPIFRARGI